MSFSQSWQSVSQRQRREDGGLNAAVENSDLGGDWRSSDLTSTCRNLSPTRKSRATPFFFERRHVSQISACHRDKRLGGHASSMLQTSDILYCANCSAGMKNKTSATKKPKPSSLAGLLLTSFTSLNMQLCIEIFILIIHFLLTDC